MDLLLLGIPIGMMIAWTFFPGEGPKWFCDIQFFIEELVKVAVEKIGAAMKPKDR